jgi:glycerate 2-kinase
VPLSVVIAPDSFKGTLAAAEVAAAMAEGWGRERPDDELRLLPQADGGEGTLDAIAAALPAAVRHTRTDVTGPDGRPVTAQWLALPDGRAVVELASSSGLPLMAELDAMGATSRGLGEVIAAALDAGATGLLIGLGGSASTDGGLGALEALGLRIVDGVLDRRSLRAAPAGGVTLLSDVTAPLLGPFGAAAVFGPQKGADAAQIAALDARLADLIPVFGGNPDAPGAGAAGGTGYGLAAVWGAAYASGADHLAALTGLDDALASADVLITGEGSFDSQSLGGKVVGQQLAKIHGRSVVIAGRVTAEAPDLAYSLTELAGSSAAAMADTAHWVREAAAHAASHPTFRAPETL